MKCAGRNVDSSVATETVDTVKWVVKSPSIESLSEEAIVALAALLLDLSENESATPSLGEEAE
jgi:hypothetical protein